MSKRGNRRAIRSGFEDMERLHKETQQKLDAQQLAQQQMQQKLEAQQQTQQQMQQKLDMQLAATTANQRDNSIQAINSGNDRQYGRRRDDRREDDRADDRQRAPQIFLLQPQLDFTSVLNVFGIKREDLEQRQQRPTQQRQARQPVNADPPPYDDYDDQVHDDASAPAQTHGRAKTRQPATQPAS